MITPCVQGPAMLEWLPVSTRFIYEDKFTLMSVLTEDVMTCQSCCIECGSVLQLTAYFLPSL